MKKEYLKIKHNKIPPEKGCSLIAEPFLSEAWFQRSVIFLTEHNNEGSMGFILKLLDPSYSLWSKYPLDPNFN